MEASRHRGTYRTLAAKDKTARLQPQRFRHDRVELHSRGIPTPLQYAVRRERATQLRYERIDGCPTQYRNVGVMIMQDPFVQCEKIKDEERETLDSAKEQEFKGWGGVLIGYEDEVIPYYITSYKYYKVDISVRRVGIITAPRIPPDHPNVRYLRTLTSEFFHAPDIPEARQRAIALVEDPNTPEFLKCLDFYLVPFKMLEWENWQDPREPEGETQIHSCESQPFLNGVFKWIVKILVYEVDADC